MALTRRDVILGGSLMLAGCASSPGQTVQVEAEPVYDQSYRGIYGAILDEPYPVAAVDLRRVDPRYLRRVVPYDTMEPPGTIVVDPNQRYAYYVLADGQAIRYGVGVGRQEVQSFEGVATIGRKATWPRWIPTKDMIARDPEKYEQYADGMDGGPMNPLGPRALYLFDGGRDTLYRIHGTTEPGTIGTNVSSGCIRMFNQDVVDLYGRVPVDTQVVVLDASDNVEPSTPALAQAGAARRAAERL